MCASASPPFFVPDLASAASRPINQCGDTLSLRTRPFARGGGRVCLDTHIRVVPRMECCPYKPEALIARMMSWKRSFSRLSV